MKAKVHNVAELDSVPITYNPQLTVYCKYINIHLGNATINRAADFGRQLKLRCGYIPAQVIQHGHVCIHIIQVVGIGGVVLLCPVPWQWAVQVEDMLLWLWLIIHTVKTHNLCGRSVRDLWNPLRFGIKQINTLFVLQERLRTCWRKRCSSGWLPGFTVTSNRGMKIFSSISWKLHSCFFVW